MKRLITAVIAAAALVPSLAFAQTYYYRTDPGYTTSYSNIYQDHVTVADDRGQLSRDQDILARDRAFGNWWAINGDVNRVRQDRAQLDADLTTYNSNRVDTPRTYTYRYYRD